jgi:hypothetical protein
MSTPQPLNKPARVAIAALVVLGLTGGTLVVVHGGFETSPKRGGTPVFVPAPQAWLIAATMYGMSLVGWVALVRERWHSIASTALAIVAHGVVAVALVDWFRQG